MIVFFFFSFVFYVNLQSVYVHMRLHWVRIFLQEILAAINVIVFPFFLFIFIFYACNPVNLQSMYVVFKGPVARTKKMTETRPNATDCNRTIGCSCPLSKPVAVANQYHIFFGILDNEICCTLTDLKPIWEIFNWHPRASELINGSIALCTKFVCECW